MLLKLVKRLMSRAQKIVVYLKVWCTRRMRWVAGHALIDAITVFTNKQWNMSDTFYQIPGLAVRDWLIDDFLYKHTRQVRGDLIELFIDKNVVFSYVDQYHAYGFVGPGIHDIETSLTTEQMREITLNLRK